MELFEKGLEVFTTYDLFKYFKLDTRDRLLHFLAQIREEVGRGVTLVENLNYRCAVLPPLFSYYGRSRLEAMDDGRCRNHPANQRNIASKAYGGRMGNRRYPSTDGWDRRGRGGKMTTGTKNYRALDKHIRVNLPELYTRFHPFEDPDQVAYAQYWLISGAVFWLENKLYVHADKGCEGTHVDEITKVVNPKTRSYASRRKHMGVLTQLYT
jgi:predicted chitinase